PASLPELVARHAARTPDAPALEADGLRLTYAQLDDRVDRLAGLLVRRGAGPERTVALALGRGADLPVAALAVQRAGAAYLPVDPDYPAERVRRVLDDAAPALLVTDARTAAAGVLPPTDVPRLVLDDDAYTGEPLAPAPLDPAHAAYVIHTSGSTGTPKGVVVTHAGTAALTRGLVDRFALDADARVLQLGSPAFDISVAEMCMAFGPGATLVVPPPGPLAGESLGAVLAGRRISCAMVPPSVLATVPEGPYPALRVLAVGAEACPPGLVARWAVAGRRFHNAYGPTEATVAATLSGPLPGTLPTCVPGSVPGSPSGSSGFVPGSVPASVSGSASGSSSGFVPTAVPGSSGFVPSSPSASVSGSPSGSVPGSVPGSASGFVPTAVPGSVPSSPSASVPGSVPSSPSASVPGSSPGSVTGDGAAPPIGTPVPGTAAHVLDARLRPVPTGVAGELYLSSAGLARGYLNRPGVTAERFVADPYGPPGSRMYRTGDLAYRDDDGTLHYLGRTDDQIKLRGLRIEPGEIADALARHPSVARAAAVVREDTDGRPQLTGYAVPAPGRTVDPTALLAHAATLLPAHMVPSDVVELPALPLTRSGKLDRAALPAPRAATATRAPASAREKELCGLFARILGVGHVGADDDFFRLGGDSIMAIQLAGQASAAGLVIAPRDVFTLRTPAQLAVYARSSDGGGADVPDTGVGRFPLTPVMRWWRELGGDTAAFTQSMAFPVPPGTDPERIAAAVRGLTRRHGALRMRPTASEGEMEVVEEVPPGVGVARVAVADQDEARDRARELAAGIRLAPEDGEMLRAVWLDAGRRRPGLLLLTVHHLAVDGVSWRVIGPELAAALSGDATATPAPTTSFHRWAGLLAEEAVRPERATEAAWWRDRLASADEARLAAGRGAGSRRAAVTVELPADLTGAALTTLPAAFNCGPDAVLLTALASAAVRHRGTGTGLLVHLEGHGRQALSVPADVSRTVGWFTTQYPVLVDVAVPGFGAGPLGAGEAGAGAAVEALKAVKEQLRSVPDGGIGWGLLRHLNPDTAPALAGLPVPDVRFNYLGRITAADAAGGELLDGGPDAVPLGHAVEIDALALEGPDGLRLEATFSYAEGVLTESEVRELARLWREAIAVLARETEEGGPVGATPSDFPLVGLSVDQLAMLEGDLADLSDPAAEPEGGR
ncbi:AMP-binding protein, partial [Streptomyces sp. G44]|uniref:AMP-binding protein n=1 Tax=Streptomyces sp. G44 TaxID=2807632 RepID=UPI0019614145